MFKTGQGNEGFHTKGYIFKKDNIYDIIVGSSNLTQSAITTNKEWNIKLVARKEGEYATKVVREFDELWNSDYSLSYDDFIYQYSLEYKIAKEQRKIATQNQVISFEQSKLKPNKMQLDFIENIKSLISRGEKKALLISATGTGKTYAAAFALREIQAKKILFIVHREQIAIQAKRSFEMIFGDDVKTGLVTGTIKEETADLIFATKDTFTKEELYLKYDRTHFDAIVIDEVHRVGEQTTYKKILNYFDPKKLWLGMTASPERTDGYDIYNEFDHNIALEIRLKTALENDLLCPFHYFGITEFIGSGDTKNAEYSLHNFNMLVADKRVEYIIDKIKDYGFSGDRVKGLIFVSRIDEANELSKKFNERGFRTAVLTGENNNEKIRNKLIEKLTNNKNDECLDYIFTVNVFNEGVDIPEINQIIMLRPTESPIIFVQQLGRGLRKSKDKEFVVVLDFIGNYNSNFMIPIALSGDRSYNKDNVRKFIQEDLKFIPGSSTIQFDEISRNRIYRAIDVANFSDLKLIKQNYISLKNKLGRIPKLLDFDKYGEIDPLRIFDNKGSYYRFLVDIERDNYLVRLNDEEEKFIEFISIKLANGKRVYELELLKQLIMNGSYSVEDFSKQVNEKYNLKISKLEIESVNNILTDNFLTGSNKKTYRGCSFIIINNNMYYLNDSFKEKLNNLDFRSMVEELINFGIHRYKTNYSNRYKDTNFVLYKKYSYEDVCRLLNWDKSIVSLNIGGYKYDEKTNTYPIFINYNKSSNISDTIKYNDRFINAKNIITISKNGRTIQSNDVKQFNNSDNNNTKVYLFIRKNKEDVGAKEFYFLGQVHPNGFIEEINMLNVNTTAVEMGWQLETPVEESIFEYLTK